MPKIVLVPDIDHCIETVAKQKHAEIVRQLLTSGERNPELLEIAELLKNFLETADFRKLRAESEKHLVKGEYVEFVIYAEGAALKCDMQIAQNRESINHTKALR